MNPGLPDLEDILTPAGVSAWPPAPGWWLLALVLLLATALGLHALHRYRKKWGYRKQGLRLLDQHYRQWQQQPDDHRACQDLLSALKRVAITAYPQEKTIVHLYGNAWVNFLNAQTPTPVFDGQNATVIAGGQYKQQADMDIHALYHSCRHWTLQHRLRPETCH